MRLNNFTSQVLLITFLAILSTNLFSQKAKKPKSLIKSTEFKSEKIPFGTGGTISIVGAPVGSITIKGWKESEVEIKAKVTVEARNENDLKRLAEVCGFMFEENLLRLRIVSVGTHDKKYLKKLKKKLPKRLRGMPYRIDYEIKLPSYSDLEINGGRGDLNLSAVEGMIQINYLESKAKLKLTGGRVQATIGSGDVDVTVATRSWRGSFAKIRLARGYLNVWLPQNLNANLSAKVLRTGKITNSYKLLKPIRRTKITDKSIMAKAGNGGADLSFTVGEGILKIRSFEKPDD